MSLLRRIEFDKHYVRHQWVWESCWTEQDTEGRDQLFVRMGYLEDPRGKQLESHFVDEQVMHAYIKAERERWLACRQQEVSAVLERTLGRLTDDQKPSISGVGAIQVECSGTGSADVEIEVYGALRRGESAELIVGLRTIYRDNWKTLDELRVLLEDKMMEVAEDVAAERGAVRPEDRQIVMDIDTPVDDEVLAQARINEAERRRIVAEEALAEVLTDEEDIPTDEGDFELEDPATIMRQQAEEAREEARRVASVRARVANGIASPFNPATLASVRVRVANGYEFSLKEGTELDPDAKTPLVDLLQHYGHACGKMIKECEKAFDVYKDGKRVGDAERRTCISQLLSEVMRTPDKDGVAAVTSPVESLCWVLDDYFSGFGAHPGPAAIAMTRHIVRSFQTTELANKWIDSLEEALTKVNDGVDASPTC